QNAFYWYAMNKAVLQSRWADAYYINYANINRVEEIARILIDPNVKENINDMLFTGDYIHENFPLQSVSRSTTLSDKFNNLLYQTKFMNKYNLHIPYSHYGSMAHLNMDYQKIDSGKEKPTSVKIERKELFDFFNEDILSMLKKIEWKNEVNYEFMDSDIVISK
ncbi:MAG: hypothetical protein KA444_08475, partial [Bacteroidia bacterium]|nr:hypothetical protein [Bacteroidia bacterium]